MKNSLSKVFKKVLNMNHKPSCALNCIEVADEFIVHGCTCGYDKRAAAQALRSIPSKKRAAASRLNGKKGGRPKKTVGNKT